MDKMSVLHKDILMARPEPLSHRHRETLLKSFQTGRWAHLYIAEALVKSQTQPSLKHCHCFNKKKKYHNRRPVLYQQLIPVLSPCAETVSDNQDTMSGEPPGDVSTKAPFHEVTEQPFTFDYEDATYSQDMDEVEGKAQISHEFMGQKRISHLPVY